MSRILFLCVLLINCLFSQENCLAYKLGMRKLVNVKDVESFYPKTVEEIESRKSEMIDGFNQAINRILSEKSPSFNKTVRLFDLAYGAMGYGRETIESIAYVHPDPKMRTAAGKAFVEIEKVISASFRDYPELYEILSSIETEGLSKQHQYYLENVIKHLKRKGLSLSEDKRKQVKGLQDELAELSENFSKKIREDRKIAKVSKDDLEGMDDSFINGLDKDENGSYILTTDYPIIFPILSYCEVAGTREKLYRMMNNRAYPENEEVLNGLFAKRKLLANLLGYDTYADMQLESEMVKTPLKAKQFLSQVDKAVREKSEYEYAILKMHLPEGVNLTEDGKINPWDYSYILSDYKKKRCDLDVEALKVYFPLDNALKGLISVYESFFDIRIEELRRPSLWHEDIRLVRVSDKNTGLVYGFVLLDLFPRDGKYTHACDVPTLPSLKTCNGEYPALSLLICNFPKPTSDSPSLMRPSDLGTFFHEFGHALHDMLGRTDLISVAGTNTKYDFVEMPSQILEEWLNDPKVLQMCSSHFITGEVLPLDIALKLIEYKKSYTAHFWMKQLMLARFSLEVHSKIDENMNLSNLWKKLAKESYSEMNVIDEDHYFTSFGHLNGYAARYYGYLWSRVFALDVFKKIKDHGILNPEIGKIYIRDIIGRGGSEDPNLYLKDFLGREPTFDAFIENLK